MKDSREASFSYTAERRRHEFRLRAPARSNGNFFQRPGKKILKPAFRTSGSGAVGVRVQEGPQTRARRILISGYEHTRPGVIRREIRIKSNEPLRQGDVVESQRRLYNLSAPSTG